MLQRLMRFPMAAGIRGSKNVRPTRTEGAIGTAIYGGYLEVDETSPELSSPEQRAKTYSNLLLNTTTIAASVLYFVELIGAATWSVQPAEADTSEQWAERANDLLFVDPETPWRRIMKRASMYRFWGFSLAEWTMRRHESGYFTYLDIHPRAQRTIEYWNVGPDGIVEGIFQRSPQDQQYIHIPRAKCLYVVEDVLNDSPEGLGLFRLMVDAATRLKQLERLQGLGYEQDMRGSIKFFAPQAELEAAEASKQLAAGVKDKLLAPLKNMAKGWVTGKMRSMMFDSAVYESQDVAGRPSNVRKWDAEIMQGGPTGFETLLRVIDYYDRALARMMGTESLFVGDKGGSYALSKDKTNVFRSRIDGALEDLRGQSQKDLLAQAWTRNGWPMDMLPQLTVSPPRTPDGDEIGATIRDMAAGLQSVDGMAVVEDEDLESAARKLVAVIEQVDLALASGGSDSA